jgi:hypothetical protein
MQHLFVGVEPEAASGKDGPQGGGIPLLIEGHEGLGGPAPKRCAGAGEPTIRAGAIVAAERAGEGTETPTIAQGDAGEDVPEWARRDSNARPLAPEASALSN